MPRQPETLFKMQVQADLEEIRREGGKIWFVKVQQVALRGIPDLILGVAGFLLAIELKTSSGRLDKLQVHTLEKIAKSGCLAFVARPQSWPGLRFLIRGLACGSEDVALLSKAKLEHASIKFVL